MRPSPPFIACAAALWAGGCATSVRLPALPECHPASPAATSAERSRPSGVLSGAAPIPSAEPAVGGSAEPAGRDHLDHGAPGTDEPDAHAQAGHGQPARGGAAGADPLGTPEESPDPHAGHDAAGRSMDPNGAIAASSEAPAVVYACPIHPDQRFDEPATCPVCGEDCEPLDPAAHEAPVEDAGHDHGGHGDHGNRR